MILYSQYPRQTWKLNLIKRDLVIAAKKNTKLTRMSDTAIFAHLVSVKNADKSLENFQVVKREVRSAVYVIENFSLKKSLKRKTFKLRLKQCNSLVKVA